ncbi:MAG: 30S ribosomal protein S16 [Fimbriimonas ginsengisoli]|uniref:Small ribosomal subunit protein bS16 n=1 Tax=Fimbriimonas ginsengisoli TaxID=1005039 RepID=A0A931LV30_FIMGI|nr:30S ribosomal protein S16 [Fimbriimonas ginsengisoli]MBI3721688.1 30S ribosomal protein S16 [Fimbriimonas ginsengisoli]
MVKIRLRRIGTKGRPYYRVVVAPSTAARNGRFVESIGTYDPIVKPTHIQIDEARAMHWLMNGARPTETTAYLLNKIGILPKYFEARPDAKRDYSFLDKRTAAMSVKSAIDHPESATKTKAKADEPVAEVAAAEPEAIVEAQPEASAIEPQPEAESATEPEPPQDEPLVELEAAAEAPETAAE